jgi:hypothetical protein
VFNELVRMPLLAVLHGFIGVLNRLAHVFRGISPGG